MANFSLSDASAKQAWSTKYLNQYVAESGLKPYMGMDDKAIIRVVRDLSKTKGDLLHVPYVGVLTGAGVTGGATLEGNEEALPNYSCSVRVGHVRNAVSVAESEAIKTELDLANMARGSLLTWSTNKLRNDLVTAFQHVPIAADSDPDGDIEDTFKTYTAATAGERNAFLVANSDRLLFGTSKGNSSSGVFSTSLGTITASMKLSAASVSLAKRMAQSTTNYTITPYRTDATAGREHFVMFVGTDGYRDLLNDPDIKAANIGARPREVEGNPVFQGGDLLWDGVIIRHIPQIPSMGNVGATSATVGQAFLCGTGSLILGVAKAPEPRIESRDFGHLNKVGITEVRGQRKFSVKGVQTGMVSVFHAAAADA
jgi:hypothetical protein